MSTTTLRGLLRHDFHGARLPDDFATCGAVVVCFHGHTNSARDAATWPIRRAFPKGCCFLSLNAPLVYGRGGSYEWFPYLRDSGVDAYEVDAATLDASVDGMMRAMHLHARSRDVLRAVRLVTQLHALLAATGRDVYFVGTSQGAATAFTAALHLLAAEDKRRPPTAGRFRGGFFHHMAGVYPSAFPRPLPPAVAERVVVRRSLQDDRGRRSPRMKRGLDLHGAWLPEEARLLADAAASTLARCEEGAARLVVALSVHDHVVPIALHRHLMGLFPRHRARLPPRDAGSRKSLCREA
jgi:hypothetical protein